MRMRVEVFVFRGDRGIRHDAYLGWGHIGVRFSEAPNIFGFGPKRLRPVPADGKTLHVNPGEFAVHTDVFVSAHAAGIPVYRFVTECAEPARLFVRVRLLQTAFFSLPRASDDSRAIVTNCVGALRFLGIVLPGESMYISKVIEHLGAARGTARYRRAAPPNAY